MKRVLIISYNFPPKSGISSRRWAKLAKALTRKGVECFVLTRNGGKESGFNWTRDIQELNPKNIIEISSPYPRVLERSKSSFFFRVFKYFGIKLLKSSLFPIDAAQLWYKKLLPEAKKIIDEGVRNVIVTGPPHSVMYQMAVLKYENPHINFILDYRDAWNDEINYKLFSGIKRFSEKFQSIQKELFSLNCANSVLLVTNDMNKRLGYTFQHLSHKFITLHNFFDSEDYTNAKEFPETQKDIVYLGSLKSGRREAIKLLIEALIILEKRDFRFNHKFHFYTDDHFFFFFKNPDEQFILKKYFQIHPIIDSAEVAQILNKFEFCLSINDPTYSHAFGTKIFDYMALKKKIVHISNGGELYNLLKEKEHYVAYYDINDLVDQLVTLNTIEFKGNTDFSSFDLNSKANELFQLLQ
ncbi:MAG: hypothetical protein ACON42_06850 [Flavobacteriaceae bacterium]